MPHRPARARSGGEWISSNTTQEERCLELCFSPSETSQAAGRAWLGRIAARRQDREARDARIVATAQLQAIQAWRRGGGAREVHVDLQKITQPVLVVNAQLIVHPDAGHGAQFRYSIVFAAEVVRFLA